MLVPLAVDRTCPCSFIFGPAFAWSTPGGFHRLFESTFLLFGCSNQTEAAQLVSFAFLQAEIFECYLPGPVSLISFSFGPCWAHSAARLVISVCEPFLRLVLIWRNCFLSLSTFPLPLFYFELIYYWCSFFTFGIASRRSGSWRQSIFIENADWIFADLRAHW